MLAESVRRLKTLGAVGDPSAAGLERSRLTPRPASTEGKNTPYPARRLSWLRRRLASAACAVGLSASDCATMASS